MYYRGKMGQAKESLLSKYTTIFFVVSGYWIVSITTVFVNKILLSNNDLDAPMFIAFYQTIISVIIIIILKRTTNLFVSDNDMMYTDPFQWETIKKVLPLSLLFTGMIGTNNLCLKYVSVSFYYVGRSLTTIFNVLFTYLILGEKTSLRCICFCCIIIFGFILGVDQEQLTDSFSLVGTIFGVLGSLFTCLYAIFNKRVLPYLDQNVWIMSYYNNLYSSVLFAVLLILNGEIATLSAYPLLFSIMFITIMTIGGISGFLINIFTSLQIKYTSALTHNISGTAKACAQTILATHWYQETKSTLWWFSNAIVLFGSAGYARIKQMEMEKKHKSTLLIEKC